MYGSVLLMLVALQGGMTTANPCSPGVQVASDCLGIGDAGCCTPGGEVRWCKDGVLCEQSCDSAPACGWKTSAGHYGCAAKPKADDACANPYSCFVDGCAPMWEQAGCCNCPCEDCVCKKDPYCCGVAWDPSCVDLCRECGGCGSADGCAPSLKPGCSGCGCEICVCEVDPYCCQGKWDSLCISLCKDQCGGDCKPCVPACSGKECGSDGCGGKCGICPPNATCELGQCVVPCEKKCTGKQCGPDGCGGSCGKCQDGYICTATGKCLYQCNPDCTGKACGSDGCGGTCGQCPEDQACIDGQCIAGVCVPQCDNKQCGPDQCGWFCGFCNPGTICDPNTAKCIPYCPPQCDGKLCGDDGCGGLCGQCTPGLNCVDGQCEAVCYPYCQGKMCGSDYCGGSCGQCEAGTVCQEPPGLCVPPEQCAKSCVGKECGPDGCGGSCGTCPMDWYCSQGMCVPKCQPQCLVPPDYLVYKQCGWNECPDMGVCGICPDGYYCGPGYVCMEDKCSCAGIQCGAPDPTCPSCGGCPEGLTCDMEVLIDPQTNVCESCQPNCLKDNGLPKECGGDGCGGTCGNPCPPGFKCDEDPFDGDEVLFNCEPCSPNCMGQDGMVKQCGDDGCGGLCGQCPPNSSCDDSGKCVACIGQCMVPPAGIIPMECGPNNCPNGCLDVGTKACKKPSDCDVNQQCNALTGQCVECGSCGQCPGGWVCDTDNNDGNGLIYVCVPCVPSCKDKECGDNGCGGTCGQCPIGFDCIKHEDDTQTCEKPCEPTQGCFNKQCGPNGCPYGCIDSDSGPDCGPTVACPEGLICDPGTGDAPHWKCVNCSGGCGLCPVGEYCAEDYKCKQKPNLCAGKECGPDGQGGSCGECNDGFVCEDAKCVLPATDEGTDVVVTPDADTEEIVEDIAAPDLPPEQDVPAKVDTVQPPKQCGPCEKWFFTKCVEDLTQPGCSEDSGSSGGCSCSVHASTRAMAGQALFVAALLALTLVLRRRRANG
jgi:hypothetical protein